MRTRPKITSIEIIQYELTLQNVAPEPTIGIPMYKPGSVMQRRRHAIRIHSDIGVTGTYSGGSAMDYAAIAGFASCLLGRNPLQREDIYNGFKQAMRQQARMGVGVVDIASLCGSPAAHSRGLRPVTPRQACPVAPALRPACCRQGALPAARRGGGEASGGLHHPEGAFPTGLWHNSV